MSKEFLNRIFQNVSGENTERAKLLDPIAERYANDLIFIAKSLNNLTMKSFDSLGALKLQLDAMTQALNSGNYDGEEGKKDLAKKIGEVSALIATSSISGDAADKTYVDELVELEKILLSAFKGPNSAASILLEMLMTVALMRDPLTGQRVLDLLKTSRRFDMVYKFFKRG